MNVFFSSVAPFGTLSPTRTSRPVRI